MDIGGIWQGERADRLTGNSESTLRGTVQRALSEQQELLHQSRHCDWNSVPGRGAGIPDSPRSLKGFKGPLPVEPSTLLDE